jgi:hypothetical protein
MKEYHDMTAVIKGFQWLQSHFPFSLTVQGLLTKQNEELNGISTNVGFKGR